MSLDDEYIDRTNEALVDAELAKNAKPVEHGVVVGSSINAFKFMGKLFLIVVLMVSSKATSLYFNQSYGPLTTLGIMAVIGLVWFCLSKMSKRS